MARQPDCLGSNCVAMANYLTILCLSFLTINVNTKIEPILYGGSEY